MTTTTQEPIEKIFKYLPRLAIKNLNVNFEDMEALEDNAEIDRACDELDTITGSDVWCNRYEDTLLDHEPQTVYKWLNAIKEYFGDFTCTIYFKDAEGKFWEAQKDIMDSAEDVMRDLYDQVHPF